MRRLVMSALVAMTALVAFATSAMAQYQSGGAWNGPRGSGYYYNNAGNGGWTGRDVGYGLLGAAALISVLRPPVVMVAPPMAPVYMAPQPQVVEAPMYVNQPNGYVPAPRTPIVNQAAVGQVPVALVPQGTYVTNQPIIQSAEYLDVATGLMCRAYPVVVGGTVQQRKSCQMPSGQWATVR